VKKEINGKLIKADHNPVMVGDNFKIITHSSGNNGGGGKSGGTTKNPKPPRKTLDERIAEAVSKALVPVITRLDAMDTKITDTANLLNKVIKVNNLKTE
jgi:hypothetical protein